MPRGGAQATGRQVKKEDVIRELMSILGTNYLIAKTIVRIAAKPEDAYQKVDYPKTGKKRPMSQPEAARLVAKAVDRIKLVDEGG